MSDNREILLIFDKRLSELESKLVDIEATLEDLTKYAYPQTESKINRSAHRKVLIQHQNEASSTLVKSHANKKKQPKPNHRYNKQSLMAIKDKTEIPLTDPLGIRSKIAVIPNINKKKVNDNSNYNIVSDKSYASYHSYEETKEERPEQEMELKIPPLTLELDKCTVTESLNEEGSSSTSPSVKESYGLLIEESDD